MEKLVIVQSFTDLNDKVLTTPFDYLYVKDQKKLLPYEEVIQLYKEKTPISNQPFIVTELLKFHKILQLDQRLNSLEKMEALKLLIQLNKCK